LGYGLIGFVDDYIKVTQQNSRGLSGKLKLILQLLIAIIATIYIMSLIEGSLATSLAIPFFKSVLIDLGWFFIIFSSLVMVGSSNAVNLTDGLDGLAIVPVMIVAGVFVLIA
jgi:phospho-N-acetylmuramoyl-pentapeptide-transferase